MAQPIPVAHAQTGNSLFAHLRAMRSNLIAYLEHLAQQGDLLRIRLGLASAYFVNHPDYVREVLVTQAHKSQKPFGVKQAARALFVENLFTTAQMLDRWAVGQTMDIPQQMLDLTV